MRKFVVNHRGILSGLALVTITFAAYMPVIQDGGFIWDDPDYVTSNKMLRDANGLKQIWTNPKATPQYYPLVHTTFWIEYHLWKLDPTGYHVNNVLLHALGAVLLWRILLRLKVPGAWLAAGLFAVHPVHVESVAWITERKNVLSGVFYLGSALAYLKWAKVRARNKIRHTGYLLALLLYICALLSKTVTSTLPAALVLILWWKNGFQDETVSDNKRLRWNRILVLVPFFLIGLIASYITVLLEKQHVGATGAEWDLSFIDRCLIAGRAVWFYAGKLIWPTELCFNYPRWEINAGVWWQYLYPLSVIALVVLLWAFRKRTGKGPLAAVLFFGGTLLPALGFFDVYPMRYSFVADHFQYLASIGILTLASTIIVRLCRQRTAGFACASIMLLFACLTAEQCRIYQNLETLWLDTIKKNPASWMAYNNLGQLYILKGNPAAAIPVLEKVIHYNPLEVEAYYNLGVAVSRLGRKDEAMAYYRKALEVDPNDPQVYNNIGATLARYGKLEEAVSYYQKALAIDPKLFPAHSNLGAALSQLGRIDEAIEHHRKSIDIEPDFGAAHFKYGETLQIAGRIHEAEEQYRIAVSLDPSMAEAQNKLGEIAATAQLLPAALHHFRLALEKNPDFAEAHRNMAMTLASVERFPQAEQHFKNALQLTPNAVAIRLDYADFLLQRGRKTEARDEYLTALKLLPESPDILFQIGMIDQQLGNMADAERRFRGVLQFAPDHAPAHNHLAVLLAGQGKNNEAVDLLRQAVKLDPGNAEFYNNLGVILVRYGNKKDALEALEEAVRLNPDYVEAKKNLNDLRDMAKDGSQQ